MTVIETLTVRVDADTADLRHALAQLDQDVAAATSGLDQDFVGLSDSVGRIGNTTQKLGGVFVRAFADAASGGRKLSDVLKELEKDILRLLIHRAVAGTIADTIGKGLSGFGLGAGIAAMFPLPFFAEGGRPRVGAPSLVGERGPEIFVPDIGGTILPRTALGGTTITINQNIAIAPDVSAVARAEIAKALPAIRAYAMQGVYEAKLRGAAPV
jgi:hypothetical protein